MDVLTLDKHTAVDKLVPKSQFLANGRLGDSRDRRPERKLLYLHPTTVIRTVSLTLVVAGKVLQFYYQCLPLP